MTRFSKDQIISKSKSRLGGQITYHVILNFVFFSFVHYITFVLAIPTIKPTVHPRQLCVLACTRLFALSNIMSKIRIFLWCPYKEVRTQDFSAQCYRQLSSDMMNLLLMQFVSAGKTINHLWSLACIYTYRARELKDRNRKEF